MRAVLFLAIGLAGCPDHAYNGPPGGSGGTTGGVGVLEPLTAQPGNTQNVTPPFKPGLLLSSSVQLLDQGVTSNAFNFAHLSILWVRVNIPGMGRATTINLKLIGPRDNVMYEADLPYVTDPTITMMDVPDVKHPVSTHKAKPAVGGFHLDYPIAVAGSHLTKYPEPGTWRIEATVSDTGQAYATTLDVTVAQ